MDNKNKLKTFVIGAVTTLLTSCGFKSNDAQKDDAKMQNPVEKVVENESIDKVINTMADEVGKTRWNDPTSPYIDMEQDTEIIKDFLAANNMPYVKGDSILRSADWVYETVSDKKEAHVAGQKLVNPVYEKSSMIKKGNVETHPGVTIRRKDFKVINQEIDNIYLSDVTHSTKETHFEKVKKMVEDKKLEQGLRKGDTVEVSKLMPPKTRGGDRWHEIKKEKAVVQKDGVSPTYKEYDNTKTQHIMKLKFDYTFKDKD